MSKFPKWWNSTITVYNRYEDPTTQQITWYRTVLTGCFWKTGSESLFINSDVSMSYRGIIICRIPRNDNFLPAYDWKANENRASYFTLKNGDIIINGEVTDTIDEYTKGSRSSDLMEKYKDLGVLVINTFTDNSDVQRNIPHYFVSEGM